ncbi:MAG: hypothetical protein LBC85_06595 [Fibromonadaceae bacterium]|jgi:hypothetical protein|nr:hypothetical protein [Fibromonadaceae bacterium]
MRIFSKILPFALSVLLTSTAFASSGIYDRDLVRGFLSGKVDYRGMNSTGIEFINRATGMLDVNEYKGNYIGTHIEIGAEYDQLRTWFDIEHMVFHSLFGSIPSKKGSDDPATSWYTYGLTWMWGYKLLPTDSKVNIIPAVGPGLELLNVRTSRFNRVESSLGATLNTELELRLQFSQFSAGIYGGYKFVRHDGANDDIFPDGSPYTGDVNSDKAFIGLKLSWTMLNKFQKRERDLQ